MTICRKTYLLVLLLLASTFVFAQREQLGYGVKSNLNFSTVKAQYDKYLGVGKFSGGVFLQYAISSTITLAFEPTYTSSAIREKQTDNRYTFGHIDLNLNSYYNLFRSDAVYFYFGLRPAMLLSPKSESLVNGNYVRTELAEFKNKKGNVDLGVNAGISIRLSPVVSFDLGYYWSATNNTDNNQVSGRPSLVEVGLKLNAVDIKNMYDQKLITTKQKVQRYKEGSLLIMLPTYTQKELAKLNEADKQFAINELNLRNTKVVAEFKKHYQFTPVYFFFDVDVNNILSGAIKGNLLNENMLPDSNITIANPANFFVASFCNDISAYSDRLSYGLFVYDEKMVQLEKPFNVPSQMFGLFTEGDPANYFKSKRQSYINMPFDRVIRKFNSRMNRYADF